MWLVFRDAFCLLTSWWTKDRIRIPRAQGKLFRVLVGDRLIIRDSLLIVRARRNRVLDGVPQIMLTLSAMESGREGKLQAESAEEVLWYLTYMGLSAAQFGDVARARIENCACERIVVNCGSETFDLFPDEVSVLQASCSAVH